MECVCDVDAFQFHKGSIKTQSSEPTSVPLSCFNSIKVRLRRSDFDSMRKQLEFQFHKGSIKTGCRCKTVESQYVSIP